jgi:hypothetical protein
LEAKGIATVCLSHLEQASTELGIPRTVAVDAPMGRALGRPGDHEGHVRVLRACLELGAALERGEVARLEADR